jgi:hypothetical protein
MNDGALVETADASALAFLMRPRATQQIPMRASIAHASGMVSRFATVYFARAMGLFVMVKIDCKSG